MNRDTFDTVLKVENRLDELNRVASFLNDLGVEWALNERLVNSLNLVLEEALSNIILYGYNDELRHTIEIYFKNLGDEIFISIVDDGMAYNPTLRPDPDISLSVEDRPVGGLGVFLIKKLMDSAEYLREGNKNILNLKKNMK
ncbi:MAG: ATP-binding protein [Prolixibacteraceae bacterium]|jgi:anti-sigma regulatory factor (Ser/Thr protein kinase)|nr:ATP-binding protein [Prolixibacteraceae bacterium]